MIALDALLLATALLAAVTDLLERKIYNLLTFPVLVVGIAAHALVPEHRLDGLVGVLVVGVPLIALYAVLPKAIAPADSKLFMALAALSDWRVGGTILLLSIVLHSIPSAIALVVESRLAQVGAALRGRLDPAKLTMIPFGATIGVASLVVLFVVRR